MFFIVIKTKIYNNPSALSGIPSFLPQKKFYRRKVNRWFISFICVGKMCIFAQIMLEKCDGWTKKRMWYGNRKGYNLRFSGMETKVGYPVTFREFLRVDAPQMYEYLESLTEIAPLPEIVMGRVGEAYRRYQVCGGMPAAVTAMLDKWGGQEVEEIQKSILTAYALDFAKHAPGKDIPRIAAIWNSIPSQLAKENRKFVYKLVKTGARAREYEDALFLNIPIFLADWTKKILEL